MGRRAENPEVRWFFAACFVSLAACGNPQGAPPCEAVGAKFVALAKRDLDGAKLDDDTRRLVLDQIPAMRDSLVNACKDAKWTPQVRSCLHDATDHASFETCQRALTAAQRDRLERGDAESQKRDEDER